MQKKYPDNIESVDGNQLKKRNRKSFIIFFIFCFSAIGIFFYIKNQEKNDGIPKTLRSVLNANEKLNETYKTDEHLAPEFEKEKAVKQPKVNGSYGVREPIDTGQWTLNIYSGKKDKDSVIIFTMADIKKFQKTDVIFDFKCIEGWNEVTHWGGVRLYDFLQYYKLGTHSGNTPDKNNKKDIYKYIGMETPDGKYYVGIDMPSALHPQTILCYEMNGKPLPENQGAPLRLIIPVKYGVKHIKRIGKIFFSDERPHDYWAEQGYDYDSAL